MMRTPRPAAGRGPRGERDGSQQPPRCSGGAIAVSILVYVILDGFDLGVGVLFSITREELHRVAMMDSIAPFWDGNETWLVVIGAGLFAAFGGVRGVSRRVLHPGPAAALRIFRGIAFEFRFRAERMRRLWDYGFFLGSVVGAFVQGTAVGAMMRGIPVENGQYAGGAFFWLAPFPILTKIGLVLGYALLGAGWLVLESEGALREWAYAEIAWLAAAVLAVPYLAFALTFDYSVLARSHLHGRRRGLVFPAIDVLALLGILIGARRKRDSLPFAMTVLFFLAAYLTLGVMFWPYMVPYTIAVASAAVPEASLSFLFYGGVVLPVITVYTIVVYWVFRGRVRKGYG